MIQDCRAVMDARMRALGRVIGPLLSDLQQDTVLEQFEAICRAHPLPAREVRDQCDIARTKNVRPF